MFSANSTLRFKLKIGMVRYELEADSQLNLAQFTSDGFVPGADVPLAAFSSTKPQDCERNAYQRDGCGDGYLR